RACDADRDKGPNLAERDVSRVGEEVDAARRHRGRGGFVIRGAFHGRMFGRPLFRMGYAALGPNQAVVGRDSRSRASRSRGSGSRAATVSPRPENARGQLTDMLAPPAGDVAIRQRPLVARTIESAMARPRPAPPAASVA